MCVCECVCVCVGGGVVVQQQKSEIRMFNSKSTHWCVHLLTLLGGEGGLLIIYVSMIRKLCYTPPFAVFKL